MHPNEQLLRDFDEAQLKGEVARLGDFFTEDVIVHVGGKSSLAGTTHGRDAFFEKFQQFSQRVQYTFEPHAYFADDEHGVELSLVHYARGDRQVDSNDLFVCHFRDGKISEAWIISYDNDAVDALLE
jgi:ketosteroid isomerase-like protein